MATVRELTGEDLLLAGAVLLELRPHLGDAAAAVERIRAVRRSQGTRVLAAWRDTAASGPAAAGGDDAEAVAVFRVVENSAWGRTVYVDDLVTAAAVRGGGLASALLDRVTDEARALDATALHLDSGVQPERRAAHALYLGRGMRISSFHFEIPLG